MYWIVILLTLLLATPCQADVSTFVCQWGTGSPVVPPMDGNTTQLTYTESGTLKGGYAVVGPNVTPSTDSVIVLIWSTKATIDAMKADTARFIWIEDIDPVDNSTDNGTPQASLWRELFGSGVAWAAGEKSQGQGISKTKEKDKPVTTQDKNNYKKVLKIDGLPGSNDKVKKFNAYKLDKRGDQKAATMDWHGVTNDQYQGAQIGR